MIAQYGWAIIFMIEDMSLHDIIVHDAQDK